MITRKTRRGVLALVVLTAVSFWISHRFESDLPRPVSGLDPKLDYVLRDFELQFFDVSGEPSINLRAPVLRNDPALQQGTIERPVIRLSQPGVTWNLTARKAVITADKEHVFLAGSVKLQRHRPASGEWAELDSSEVRIEVTPQTASTERAVRFFDGLNRMQAVGMDLDMKTGKFRLRNKVNATYAAN